MSLAERVNARLSVPDPKILVIDIERLPGIGKFFDLKVEYLAPRNVVEWPRLLCWAARWYGETTTMFEAEWKNRDRMIKKVWDLYDAADVVVTFNGIRFDNAHLKTDWLESGMPPPSPWADVDLYRVVKQFGFESKSLDSVTRRLGREGKQTHYSMDMAQGCVDGDRRAQRLMRSYNIGDIDLTLWLYDRLRGWIPSHPHLGPSVDKSLVCTQCGSAELVLQPSKYRTPTFEFDLYRCAGCGGMLRAALGGTRLSGSRGVK